jgi:hypothetical protein
LSKMVTKWAFQILKIGTSSPQKQSFAIFRKYISHWNPTSPGVDFLYFKGSWAPLCPTFRLENLPVWSTELYNRMCSFFMTFATNYLSSKRWEKVGHQELHSTSYKREIDPRPITLHKKHSLHSPLVIKTHWT